MKKKMLRSTLAPNPVSDYSVGQEPSVMVEIPRKHLVDIQNVVNEYREGDSRIKGSWTRREDTILKELVEEYGARKWKRIAMHLKGRVGKQCRERWMNHLDPRLDHAEFRPEEDVLIVKLHTQYGNQWSKISRFLKGRTANKVKNRWNSCLSKKDDSYDSVFVSDDPNSLAAMIDETENLMGQVEEMGDMKEDSLEGDRESGGDSSEKDDVEMKDGRKERTPKRRKPKKRLNTKYITKVKGLEDSGGYHYSGRHPSRPFPFTFTSAPQQAMYDAQVRTIKIQEDEERKKMTDEDEDDDEDKNEGDRMVDEEEDDEVGKNKDKMDKSDE